MTWFEYQECSVRQKRMSVKSISEAAHIGLPIILARRSLAFEEMSKARIGLDLDADVIPVGLTSAFVEQLDAIRDSHKQIKKALEELLRTHNPNDWALCVINAEGTSNLRRGNDSYGFIFRSSAEGVRDTNLQVRMGLGKVVVATNQKIAVGLLPETVRTKIMAVVNEVGALHSGQEEQAH